MWIIVIKAMMIIEFRMFHSDFLNMLCYSERTCYVLFFAALAITGWLSRTENGTLEHSTGSRTQTTLTNTEHARKHSRSSRQRAEAREYSTRSRIQNTLATASRSSRQRAEACEHSRSSRIQQKLTAASRSPSSEQKPP